jgi:hypothetical protein
MYQLPDPHVPIYSPDADTVLDLDSESMGLSGGGGAPGESSREDYADPLDSPMESRVETYEDKNLRRLALRNWITGVIYFLLGVLEVILGLRFIFRLLGANEGNDFIMSLYSLSHAFVGPFNNIFNDQSIGSRSIFELSTLVALLIYALIGWGLAALTRVVLAPTYGGQQVATPWRQQR